MTCGDKQDIEKNFIAVIEFLEKEDINKITGGWMMESKL